MSASRPRYATTVEAVRRVLVGPSGGDETSRDAAGTVIQTIIVLWAMSDAFGLILLRGHYRDEGSAWGPSLIAIVQFGALANLAGGFGIRVTVEGKRRATTVGWIRQRRRGPDRWDDVMVVAAIGATLLGAHAGYRPNVNVGVLPLLASDAHRRLRTGPRVVIITAALGVTAMLPAWLHWRSGLLTAGRVTVGQARADAALIVMAALFRVVLAASAGAVERVRDARRQLDEDTKTALERQRMGIARDLHDVVAHQMSVVVVQAQAAAAVLPDGAGPGRETLTGIEVTTRNALIDLRRLLHVLRTDTRGDQALDPQPGLDDLDDLVRQTEAGGVTVRLHREGDAVAVSPGVAVSAYRIVQEALANAIRHAPASHIDVTIRHAPGRLCLTVTNDGVTTPSRAAARHGLTGIEERARLVGGTASAGPVATNRWEVSASLPI